MEEEKNTKRIYILGVPHSTGVTIFGCYATHELAEQAKEKIIENRFRFDPKCDEKYKKHYRDQFAIRAYGVMEW